MSMTNDMQSVRKITKELGSEIVGVGNIFWEKVDLESKAKTDFMNRIMIICLTGKRIIFIYCQKWKKKRKLKNMSI